MSKSRHIQRQENEGWTVKSHEPFNITCCDCGLAHTLVVCSSREGEELGIAAKREPRITGQLRRRRDYVKK